MVAIGGHRNASFGAHRGHSSVLGRRADAVVLALDDGCVVLFLESTHVADQVTSVFATPLDSEVGVVIAHLIATFEHILFVGAQLLDIAMIGILDAAAALGG